MISVALAVDKGARVLNLSLGSAAEGQYDEGLNYAADRDAIVVAAVGNALSDAEVTALASNPGVLAASAVDRKGEFRADISVEGAEVALAAPEVEVTPTSQSGTSFAAAVVSGTATLVRAEHPSLTAPEMVEQLTSTATDKGSPGP